MLFQCWKACEACRVSLALPPTLNEGSTSWQVLPKRTRQGDNLRATRTSQKGENDATLGPNHCGSFLCRWSRRTRMKCSSLEAQRVLTQPSKFSDRNLH